MKKVLAFIPVRGGSKSIPLKNIKDFCGKPLIYWNLEALEKVSSVDRIVVATDSDQIKSVVESFRFPKVELYDRDPANALDTSSTESVMLEYIINRRIDDDIIFMLVQATSPLTQDNDYEKAIEQFFQTKVDSLLSCTRNYRFFWDNNGSAINYDYKKRPRRQDFNGILLENGAFYINTVKRIKKERNRLSGKIGIYEMDEYKSVEIDEPDDWGFAEKQMYKYVLTGRIKEKKIKLFLTDVDGVLTDAGMYYTEFGDELKKFNTLDGKAFELLRNMGIKTGIITSENTEIVRRRAEKIKSDYLFQNASDKLGIATDLCEKENISLSEVAYIGDDVNDYELLNKVGVAAVPLNGVKKIKSISGILALKTKGGDGAVREFVEYLLGDNVSSK